MIILPQFKSTVVNLIFLFLWILLLAQAGYSQSAPQYTQQNTLNFSLDAVTGKALFEKVWVSSPSSTAASDGLGPFYNARSCNQCHPDGGRGMRAQSMVLHIDDPVYGQQLQKYAVSGLSREAEVRYVFSDENNLPELVRPKLIISDLSYGALQTDSVSARLAPSLRGLGLLAMVPDRLLIELADEVDKNGDGISGKINQFVNPQGETLIGRFGWKAGQVSLTSQLSRALSLDLGLGNPMLPSAMGDCTSAQALCDSLPNGNSAHHNNLEVNSVGVDLLLSYVRELAVPMAVDLPAREVEEGASVFNQLGCAACHLPVIETDAGSIRPFTDLLLHDMGPGLADGLAEGAASGNEWRTAPLWGLNQIKGEYLHDGRAETIHGAILWHDGEAAQAREKYLGLRPGERGDLFVFLNSL